MNRVCEICMRRLQISANGASPRVTSRPGKPAVGTARKGRQARGCDAMNVEALDHVNIITDRLDETAEFYGRLLGLVRKDAPPPLTPETATWMFDAQDRAIIHINSLDCYRTYDREVEPGSLTGALHHVALKCVGY